MSDNKNPLHRIEDVKRKLYERDFDSKPHRKEGVLHSTPHEVPAEWKDDVSNKTAHVKTKLIKKFFIAAMIFFFGAIAFGIYTYMHGTRVVSNDNIEITVLGNAFTEGGEELPIQIEIVNKNNAALELANLIIEYPKGAGGGADNDVVRLPRESIGTIPAGGRVVKSHKVVLYGDQNTVRNVVVKLEYHPEGSNAIFTKEKAYPVTINSSPLELTIDGPISTSSDQQVTFNITANLKTSLPEKGAMLKFDYPTGFKFDSAIPSPAIGDSLWNLDNLAPGKPISILVKGTLTGQDEDEKAFHVYVGTVRASNKSMMDVVYNSLLHSVVIQKPFLEATVYVEGQNLDQYSSVGGKAVRAQVVWANNLPTRVLDAEISVKFSGNVFNKESVVVSDGFFDSVNNQIIWNRNTNSEFASLEPGAVGRFNFSFVPTSLFGNSQDIRDPQVVMEVSIRGRESGGSIAEVTNFTKKIVKIISDFQIAAQASYSKGPLPPKAESETTYVINWTLSNSVNTVNSAEARVSLPVYVKWGGITAGSNENIRYDEASHQVVWNIGTVRPNTGFGSINREASFNLILKPSITQVGGVPELTKGVILTGIDAFSMTALQSSRQPLTTRLENDLVFKIGDEIVVK